jgi:tetratricopeptide (TPR) repeat protein
MTSIDSKKPQDAASEDAQAAEPVAREQTNTEDLRSLRARYSSDPYRADEFKLLPSSGTDDEEKRWAFDLASRIPNAIHEEKLDDALEMARLSVLLDPMSFDAYVVDIDTPLCGYSELILAMQHFYRPFFARYPGQFHTAIFPRPYLRALENMADAARDAGRTDLATTIYEELLRLDHEDKGYAGPMLVVCYLQLIARQKQGSSTTISRDITDLQGLLNAGFETISGSPMKPWAEIFIAWETGEHWQSLANAERTRLSGVIARASKTLQGTAPPTEANPTSFDPRSEDDLARIYGPYLAEVLRDWPVFLTDLQRFYSWTLGPISATDKTSEPDALRRDAAAALEDGKTAMRADDRLTGLKCFTKARHAMSLSNFPGRKWYLGADFAISSNRSRCAVTLRNWALARIDSRFTLAMKPDHIATYNTISAMAKGHGCRPECVAMHSRIEALVREVESGNLNDEQWQNAAQRGIALLSLSTVIAARTGGLTDQFLEERVKIGIEDMFAAITVSPEVHPLLPWREPEHLSLIG